MEWYKEAQGFTEELDPVEEEVKRHFKILFFGVPGTPIFELGELISEYFDSDYFTIEREYEDYWTDKIPSVYFDTGDEGQGSESQNTNRDPETESKKRAIDRFLNIPNSQPEPMSTEDRNKIFSIQHGVVVTEIAESVLLPWVRNGNGVVFFLDLDEENAVQWLQKRNKCPACGTVVHMEDSLPKEINMVKRFGVCPRCGSNMSKRETDSAGNVRHQYNVWRQDFTDFKKQMKKMDFIKIQVDKKKSFDAIFEEIKMRLVERFT